MKIKRIKLNVIKDNKDLLNVENTSSVHQMLEIVGDYDTTSDPSCFINFISLEEIQKRNYPDITGRVIFMIDYYFIMNDVNSYRLDEDYISKCELLSSKDFDVFKNQSVFSVIRIFTKRDQSSRLR